MIWHVSRLPGPLVDRLLIPFNHLYFLTELFDKRQGYSGLNTARCALSSVIQLDGNKTVGSYPLVNRFLEAVFNPRPFVPRYQSI